MAFEEAMSNLSYKKKQLRSYCNLRRRAHKDRRRTNEAAASTHKTCEGELLNKLEAEEILRATRYWHYPFDLPWMSVSPTRATPHRHYQRQQHIFKPLLELYGGSLDGCEVLDLACCQGFWSFAATRAGAAHCLGIDSSPTFIREAEALRTVYDICNCEFRCEHLENDDWWKRLTPRHVTFFFGLFYHLADPVFVLRQAMRRTTETIIIDTEVTKHKEPVLSFFPRNPDEQTTKGSNVTTTFRVVPSRAALEVILTDGGFTRINFLKPLSSMPREYRKGQRVTVIGVTGSRSGSPA